MVPHFKNYLIYSQRNSNSKLGLLLQMLKTGVDGPSVKASIVFGGLCMFKSYLYEYMIRYISIGKHELYK